MCAAVSRSREPSSIVKPIKAGNATPEAENKHNEKLAAAKPKAVRHLILVRHGQYNVDGETDAQCFLTDVGRQQAEFTGERLKALEIPWDLMIKSTMQRAQETGKIIAQKVGDEIPYVQNCSLIEEGAPIAPEPPIGHWRPEPAVCANLDLGLSSLHLHTIYWHKFHTLTHNHHYRKVFTYSYVPKLHEHQNQCTAVNLTLLHCSSSSRTARESRPASASTSIAPRPAKKRTLTP